MTRERYIKMIAGAMVLISSLGAYFLNINWIWIAVFVGANLFQFSITKWCLLNNILKLMGVQSEMDCCKNDKC